MKILLINPYFQAVTKYERIEMPLGLMYLASVLEKANFQVEIIDASVGLKRYFKKNTWHYGDTIDELIVKIKKSQPDIVGLSCIFSMRFPAILEITQKIKKINKKIITVIGGTHPTIFAKQILNDYNFFDYIILGEGEYSFLNLIKIIQSGNSEELKEINGLAYRRKDQILINPKTTFIENLDDLPFPARHLLPVEEYLKDNAPTNWGLGSNRQFSILTSRSCPNRCTFCSMYLIHGAKCRPRSPQNVLDEIEFLVNKYQAKEICIEDDNLTFSKQRIIDICQGIINRGIKIAWNTPNGVAVKHLDYEILKKMKEAGCVSVNLAIESADDYMRNTIIKKNLPQEKIYEIIKACKKVNLKANAFFVLGMPGETKESLENNIKMLDEVHFNGIAVLFATPFPGTELFKWVINDKMISQENLDNIMNGNFILYNKPVIELKNISSSDLIRYKKKMMFTWIKRNFFDIVWSIIQGKNDFFRVSYIIRFLKFYLPSK
ncbi:B12-binding domain-containing radical SAM protein [Patescibacteria group bacterium]|nr:B12-binding domain-containing radical SAM protein [Patescibacteria group bacterium]